MRPTLNLIGQRQDLTGRIDFVLVDALDKITQFRDNKPHLRLIERRVVVRVNVSEHGKRGLRSELAHSADAGMRASRFNRAAVCLYAYAHTHHGRVTGTVGSRIDQRAAAPRRVGLAGPHARRVRCGHGGARAAVLTSDRQHDRRCAAAKAALGKSG